MVTGARPTKRLRWVNGLKAVLGSIGAKQSDPYSWIATTADRIIFTAEMDHRNQESNRFSRLDGVFIKKVRPISKGRGDSPPKIRHATELFDAVARMYSQNSRCELLILKGTANGTTKGGVKGAIDGHDWVVDWLEGSVDGGFSFILRRIE